ncbi:MAG TPA: Gfo/Idh/MocA family oxidoreductase [Acidimicrobiales bacterium]|nr:Gfo/Idh/MocA family oxidoreductase [Acidimicrobiales bacterium]
MLDVAVVGAGIMGTNHGRVLGMIPDARVAVVVDADAARGGALARALDAEYSPGLDGIAELAQAAVVATPTSVHEEVGVALLDAGLHVLVEKPFAPTIAACEHLVDAARRAERRLMVGHVERFNPAVMELVNLLDDIVHIEIARIGPRSPRVSDDVVLDLMIHDLDLALALARSPVSHVSAVGRHLDRDRCELASALLRFENGITASITASQVGQNKIRRIDVTQRDNFVTVDLVKQDISVNRVTHTEFISDEGTRYRQSGMTEIPFLEHRGEPLLLELRHFVDCVRSGATPRVRGEDGTAAVALALRVQELVAER